MIYAVQPLTGGPVKIGCSADVSARIRQLEFHYGQPLALLATMPGGRDQESAIHARFAHLRLGRTEQFRPAADLLAYLGRPLLVGANPGAVEAMAVEPYVRLRGDVVTKARYLCARSGRPLIDYLSDILQPEVDRQFQEAAKDVGRGASEV